MRGSRPGVTPPFDSAGHLDEDAGTFPMKRSALLVTLALLTAAGCARKETAAHDQGPGHAHTAPHGGVLVELGEHEFNLEFAFDGKRGVLQAWMLDGHAENFVRVPLPGFEVEARAGAEARVLDFVAVADTMTGETVGDTATFEAAAEWLRDAKAFDGRVKAITVRGNTYRDVTFKLSAHENHPH
jgi:hypothetical protein